MPRSAAPGNELAAGGPMVLTARSRSALGLRPAGAYVRKWQAVPDRVPIQNWIRRTPESSDGYRQVIEILKAALDRLANDFRLALPKTAGHGIQSVNDRAEHA